MNCEVICDAPFAWENERTYNYNNPSGNILFQNLTDYNDYTYPKIQMTCNKAGGTISIINKTDENRETKLVNLSQNEVITLDNSLQIITSSLDLNRLSNFNKKFFRLLPNLNTLSVSGNISNLKIMHKPARKVGC